jgi:1,2-diacylglycerol 3-beta-galactosyltransferase
VQAGPGTIAEAMCRSLPTMLSCHLPGQEAGNIPFVVDGGFGAYSKQPKEIAATVAKWMSDDEMVRKVPTAKRA